MKEQIQIGFRQSPSHKYFWYMTDFDIFALSPLFDILKKSNIEELQLRIRVYKNG